MTDVELKVLPSATKDRFRVPSSATRDRSNILAVEGVKSLASMAKSPLTTGIAELRSEAAMVGSLLSIATMVMIAGHHDTALVAIAGSFVESSGAEGSKEMVVVGMDKGCGPIMTTSIEAALKIFDRC